MRILVISHLFPTNSNRHFGIFSARQFMTMRDQGAEVIVFVPMVWIPTPLTWLRKAWRRRFAERALVKYDGIETHQVPYVRLTRGFWSCRWEGLSVYLAMKKQVLAMHRKKPFDAIYGKCFFPGADTAVRLSKLLHIPAIGEGIGSDVHVAPNYSKTMYNHFVKVANALDGAVADGKSVADKISAVSGKTVPTVHGLVNLDIFAPAEDKMAVRQILNLPRSGYIILFVGGLKDTKGVYEMLDAFCRVRLTIPPSILKICGTGQEYASLKAIITERRLETCVTLVGAVEADEVAKWMQASDVLILPSYSEGMPNVVMEAMACGLPVISTRVGGLPEAVGSCKGAILIEPKNVEQLEEAMVRIAKDPDLQIRMSIAARQKAVAEFGAIPNTQKIIDFVGSVISNYKQ